MDSMSLKTQSISLLDCSSTVAPIDQMRQNTNHFSTYKLQASISSSGFFFRFLHKASKSLQRFLTQADSLVSTSSLHCNLFAFRILPTYLVKRSSRNYLYSSVPGLLAIQTATIGSQPSSSISKQIIPALDTVAGDATAKLSTSNRRRTLLERPILSPLFKVSSLLSSSTEFMDSIQSVSTGPSRIIH